MEVFGNAFDGRFGGVVGGISGRVGNPLFGAGDYDARGGVGGGYEGEESV